LTQIPERTSKRSRVVVGALIAVALCVLGVTVFALRGGNTLTPVAAQSAAPIAAVMPSAPSNAVATPASVELAPAPTATVSATPVAVPVPQKKAQKKAPVHVAPKRRPEELFSRQ
jgi:hypothetical protein